MTERASEPGDPDSRALVPPPTVPPSDEATVAALSDRLGGAVVALVAVDTRSETATPLAVHDPDPAGDRALRLLVGAAVPLEGTICATVCATGEPAQVGQRGSVSDDALPDGWLHYSRQHGVNAAIALAVEPRRPPDQILVVARRSPEAYEPDEIDDIVMAARSLLIGSARSATPAESGEAGPDESPRSSDAQRELWGADVILGAIPPAVVSATLGRTSDPNAYRPTAVLVLAVAAMGLLRGRVAAATCAAATVGVIWWTFIPPARSLRIADRDDLVGLVVLAIALCATWMLVDRVDRGRRKLADAAGLSDALVDQMPVAFALAGRNRRLRRVNQRFADLTGTQPELLLGGLPSAVHPATGARNEALVQQVLDSGEPVLDTVLEADRPEVGIEHTWRANHFPIRSGDSVVAVGMTLEDITEDVTIRRRAQLLLRLSRRVAGATTAGEIGEAVTEILAEGLRARCLFAARHGDRISITASAGYHDPAVAGRWGHLTFGLGELGTLATALRASELVLASIPPDRGVAEGSADGDADAETSAHQAGGVTVAWQPVSLPGAVGSAAAFGVAWPYERRLTQHSRTLLQTAASVTGLALARVELTDQTARDGFRHAMDAMLDQVVLARAIRDGSGAIVDFELDFANTTALASTGRTAEATTGRRVRELYPNLVASGLFDRFCQVVESGVPWEAERLPYQDEAADGRVVEGWWNIQVMKVDDGYLAASRDVTDLVEADRLASEAREALEREYLAVDLLQRAALPTTMPVIAGLDVGAHYRPAQLRQPVGGDWYDAFSLDDGELALVVADVAGHGQEAAAYMVQVRNIFRAVATEHHRPEEVLVRVDRVLQRLNEPGAPFVTCCYATLVPATGELRWALAGHPPPVLARGDGSTELCASAPGPPLATLPGMRYETGSATLATGDLLVLYTDGLIERRGEGIDDGLSRVADQIRDRPAGSNDAVASHLADLVPDPTDDIAILCVSRWGSASEP